MFAFRKHGGFVEKSPIFAYTSMSPTPSTTASATFAPNQRICDSNMRVISSIIAGAADENWPQRLHKLCKLNSVNFDQLKIKETET